jgi:hypothetical protein
MLAVPREQARELRLVGLATEKTCEISNPSARLQIMTAGALLGRAYVFTPSCHCQAVLRSLKRNDCPCCTPAHFREMATDPSAYA